MRLFCFGEFHLPFRAGCRLPALSLTAAVTNGARNKFVFCRKERKVLITVSILIIAPSFLLFEFHSPKRRHSRDVSGEESERERGEKIYLVSFI